MGQNNNSAHTYYQISKTQELSPCQVILSEVSGSKLAFRNCLLSVKNMGWNLDYKKFRTLLSDKYDVEIAYYFIGYVEKYKGLYAGLKKDGYEVMNIEPTILPDGNIKGNCDGDLIVEAMANFAKYDKAIIVASDGDYKRLVEYLKSNSKLERVIGCSRCGCAVKLKRIAGNQIDFLDDFGQKVEYKQKRTP